VRRTLGLFASALTLSLLSGCYSFSTLSRAHAVGMGNVEVFAAPAALIVPTDKQVSGRPVGELGARYGVLPGFDVEGRVTTLGVTAAAHAELLRDRRQWGFEMMVAPGVAYTSADKITFELPLVMGLNVRRHDQLVFAPRIAHQLRVGVPGFSRPINYDFAGLSVGYAWNAYGHLTLMPEVASLAQIYAEPGFSSNLANTVGVQAGIGVLYDF
jgi:hypothetical protein